jgi:hypothetical protein
MLRRDKWIDFDDIRFALRVANYRNTMTWLREKGFRDDLPDDDFRKMKLRSKSIAGYAQISSTLTATSSSSRRQIEGGSTTGDCSAAQ